MTTTVDRATARRVLALPMPDGNDANAATVRDYLIKLLGTLWLENDCFSGKKPFGNSGWHYDLYGPLITAGLITGQLDEWGGIEDCDSDRGDAMITAAIEEMGSPTEVTLEMAHAGWNAMPTSARESGEIDLDDMKTVLTVALAADQPGPDHA